MKYVERRKAEEIMVICAVDCRVKGCERSKESSL